MRNPQYEVVEYPLNLIFDRYVDPYSLIHPIWLQEYREEQKLLYSHSPSPKEAFRVWNENRDYFYSVYA